MDLWGRCEACDRWFYMPSTSEECPVCQRTPSVTVDRDEDPAVAMS